jgi:hypothetical protein
MLGIVWSVLTTVLFLPMALIARPLALDLAAASPWNAWVFLTNARLTWTGLAVNVAVNLLGSAYFLAMAVRSLRTTIRTFEAKEHEPKVSAVTRRTGRTGRRKRPVVGLVVRLTSATTRLAGGLVGGQLMRTHIASILAPLIFLVVTLAFLTLGFIISGGRSGGSNILTVLAYASVVSVFPPTLIVAALEACGAISREKTEHTAEVLATTPAGGPSMVWWKGAGVLAGQSASIALCVVMMLAGALIYRAGANEHTWPLAVAVSWIVAFAATLALLVALGLSLSLALKTPATAVGMAVLTFAVLTPCVQYRIAPDLWAPYKIGGAYIACTGLEIGILATGAVFLLGRNLVPALSAPLTCAAVAWMLGNAAYFGGYYSAATDILGPIAPLVGPFDLGVMERGTGAIVGIEVMTAVLLVCGMYFNFNRLFLPGAGAAK